MAEIKSTLELVMEKLAKMDREGEGPVAEPASDEKIKQGMRLAADYLRGMEVDLEKECSAAPEKERRFIQRGIIQALLRNIVLPRQEEQQETAAKAMQGLLQLDAGGSGLSNVFGEMKAILEQYLGHRHQLRQQLEQAFRQQVEQMEASLAQQTGAKMQLDPSQHPKFQEEWQRLQDELNEQYGKVLEQHKQVVLQQLTA